MHCILINLERAEARREAMTAQLRSLGMDFQILTATDWRNLGASERALVDVKARQLEGRRPLSDGMIGCHISHRSAWEMVANGDQDMAFIIEDDVTLTANIKEIVDEIERLQCDFDIVFLHRNNIKRDFVPLVPLCRDYRLGMVKYSDWGLQGYVMTKKAARHIMENHSRVIHQADHFIHGYWLHGLQTFTLFPPVVTHGNVSGEHSFLQEAQKTAHRHSLAIAIRRFSSGLREYIRKSRMFRRRTRRLLAMKN